MLMTLDDQLAGLAAEPVPAALDRLDAAVLARIGAVRTRSIGLGIGAVAVMVALDMGVAGGHASPTGAGTRAGIPALGSDQPLAPSTLLAPSPLVASAE